MLPTFKTFPQMLAAFPHEQSAIDYLAATRWANGKFCPIYGNADEAKIGTLARTNTHKCYEADCRKRFSIKVGTVFQDMKFAFRTWFAAIWVMAVRRAIKAAGAGLLFLPPDFNPIENAFSKLKALLRKAAARTVDQLWQAIASAIDAFTPNDRLGHFIAAGYEPD